MTCVTSRALAQALRPVVAMAIAAEDLVGAPGRLADDTRARLRRVGGLAVDAAVERDHRVACQDDAAVGLLGRQRRAP